MTDNPNIDPRTYFAAERTLLAWVRTGLAMMGFGFVVARFGLFLREMALVQKIAPPSRISISLWVGLTLVTFGILMNVIAVIQNWKTVRRLQRNEPIPFSPFSLASLVGVALAVVGIVVAASLLVGLNE